MHNYLSFVKRIAIIMISDSNPSLIEHNGKLFMPGNYYQLISLFEWLAMKFLVSYAGHSQFINVLQHATLMNWEWPEYETKNFIVSALPKQK